MKDGTRDGQLVVVSRDLHTAVIADGIAPTLQRVIEDWTFYAPQLQALYESLNGGRVRRAFGFDPAHCMAPLPRGYRCMSHYGDRYHTLRGDALLGARDDVPLPMVGMLGDARQTNDSDVAWHVTAGMAALFDDMAPHASPAQAGQALRLLMLANSFDIADGAKDAVADVFRSQAWYGFSPVAVTPDELGAAWSSHRLQSGIQFQVNGRAVGALLTGAAKGVAKATKGAATPASDLCVPTDFAQLGAIVARTQGCRAGTIAASWSKLHDDRGDEGVTATSVEAMVGDRIFVDMKDADGQTVFGAIELSIAP